MQPQQMDTLPKTKSSPLKMMVSQQEYPFLGLYFQGLSAVSFSTFHRETLSLWTLWHLLFLRRPGFERKRIFTAKLGGTELLSLLYLPLKHYNQKNRKSPPEKQLAQLPCIGLSSPLSNRHLLRVEPFTFTTVYHHLKSLGTHTPED